MVRRGAASGLDPHRAAPKLQVGVPVATAGDVLAAYGAGHCTAAELRDELQKAGYIFKVRKGNLN